MYVAVDTSGSDACNKFTFQFGVGGISTRMYSIKVTQISCDDPNKAPDGCTQYHFGPSTGTIQTYNYANGQHLANQKQTICIRREKGQCRICYTTALVTDFEVSGTLVGNTGKGYTKASKCCGYTVETGGYDCVQIPGARKATMMSSLVPNSRFCGRDLGLVTQTTSATTANFPPGTVCSKRTPFLVRFISDNYEYSQETLNTNKGFQLIYTQDSTSC